MKSIEKYVWACSLIGFVAFVYFKLKYIDLQFNSWAKEGDNMTDLWGMYFDLYLTAFISYLHHLVCALWLFVSASKASLSKYAWATFGLAFGVAGVACFYAASIYFQQLNILSVSKNRQN